MDETEFHKRVKSNITTIGAEQERKLKEFLVSPRCFRVNGKELSTYISGQYDKDEGFIALRKHIEEREGQRENRNR